MIRQGSLRGWLVLLVLIAVTPFLGLLAYTTHQSWVEQRRRVEGDALAGLRLQAQRVNDQLRAVGDLLSTVGALVSIDPRDVAANDATLGAARATLPPYYTGLALVDPQGRNIGFGVPQEAAGPRPSVADRAYFQAALRTRALVVGDPVISRSTGVQVIPIAQPILGPDGGVRAVMLAALEVRRLQELIGPSGLPPESVVTVITAEGVVLARSLDPQRWVGQDISTTPSVQEVIRRREGVSLHTAADGVRRVAAFTTLQVAPWLIYVGIPERVVLQPVRAVVLRDSLLGLLSLLLTLALATAMAGRLTRPLRRLAEDALALGAGQPRRRSNERVGGRSGCSRGALTRWPTRLSSGSRSCRRAGRRCASWPRWSSGPTKAS